MTSEIQVTSAVLDVEAIAKHLQLKGRVDADGWHFPMPSRLKGKPAEQHIRHWCTLLAKHKEGKRALERMEHHFTLLLHLPADQSLTIAAEFITELTRLHLSVEITHREI
ncbi:MAG: hypothetical protein ACO1QS_03175 [Verrucomicrobiota bacterium]